MKRIQMYDQNCPMKQCTALLAKSLAIGAALSLTLTACEKKGPAEELGEKIDGSAEGIKDAFEKDGPAEKVGESIDNVIDRNN